MGRGGSQSTPRDEPRRMSPSSPLRARRCAGGGGQNVMHPRGGKLGFVTVSLENGQGEKYFIPARETVTNSCGSWGVPPRARRPSFFRLWLMSSLYLDFFWGGVSRFFLRFPAPRHFLKTVEKTGSSGTPPPSRAGGLHAGAYIFSSFFAILCALCLQNLSSIYGG